jgi:hypothetical protein
MLFWIIVLVFVIYYVSKKNKDPKGKPQGNEPPKETKRRQMTDADRARLDAYRAKKASGKPNRNAPAPSGNPSAGTAQVQRQAQPDILSRAQQNVKKFEQDVTLDELEKDHEHSERVSRTVSPEEQRQKKAMHPHDASHVAETVGAEDESLLGTVEDLMVKGYDGSLSFARDFVGEGMDMISRFTL